MNDTENDLAVDDTALFNSLTGGSAEPVETKEPASPAAATTTETPAAPNADPARNEPAIPPSRLREEAEARRTAERERDELRGRLSALEKPAPAAEPAKPKDMWEDPKGFVSEALTPVQQQIREIVFDYSKDRALRDFGAEKIAAAETAMKEAIEAGTLDAKAVTAQLNASRHPVGDVVNWHLRQSALTRVGNDPDAFFKTELEKMLADPARKAELQQMLQGGPAPVVQQQNTAPVTELRSTVPSMPSIRNIGQSAAPAAVGNEPSDAELFNSVTSRRRG